MDDKSGDKTVDQKLDKNLREGIETVWDRSDQQKPRCGFGESGLCCHNCYMGPCRIHPKGKSPQRGVCGATAEVIVARNFARMIAAGAAAHSDHGRDVAKTLLLAAQSPESGYTIKDANKLRKVAQVLDISIDNRKKTDIALDVAEKALACFGSQTGEVPFIRLAPEKRQTLCQVVQCDVYTQLS